MLTHNSFWSTINKYTGTPVNAVWLVVVFCTCLDLIGIGSTLTIVAIFNVCAPALDLSYVAVIIAHRVYEKRVQFIPGPYTMGIWSKPINLVACTWVVFISVILFFPTTKPVTATNMNYAICVAGFVGLFSLSWWWIGARKYVIGTLTVCFDANRVRGTGSTRGPVPRTLSTCFRPMTRTKKTSRNDDLSPRLVSPFLFYFFFLFSFTPLGLGIAGVQASEHFWSNLYTTSIVYKGKKGELLGLA